MIGEGSLLTLEASPVGVVSIKGTIIDPRRSYAYSTTQATTTKAIASIKSHTSARLGVPVGQITVSAPVRVAVPKVEQIGWYGVAYKSGELLARVTVSANPVPATLPLLRFDTGRADDLANTAPIDIRTQDPLADPFFQPFTEITLDVLADGTTLVGSEDDFTGDVQLADTSVVTVDVEDGTQGVLDTPGAFTRFTSQTAEFLATHPADAFYAQRSHYLIRSAYATVNYVAVGKWDSAVQHYDMMASSGYAAGAFAPRLITLFNHGPIPGSPPAAHQAFRFPSAQAANDSLNVFPELVQRPMAAATAEVVSTLQIPILAVDTEVLLHEFGHGVDTFLGPGLARDSAPADASDNDCDEDSTDEAWPLDETVAQMVSLWMVRRLFPELPHEQCDLLARYTQGGTENHSLVHSPACMGPQDELNLFIRDDAAVCVGNETVCDKPDRPATDINLGAPNNCRTTDGYHAFSVLAAWWNTLNGVYCDPDPPFTCQEFAPEWPVGCGGVGAPPCVTADEAAGLALIYALRTNALSYVE